MRECRGSFGDSYQSTAFTGKHIVFSEQISPSSLETVAQMCLFWDVCEEVTVYEKPGLSK